VSILNRRNAILGWGVWQVGKASAKRKARQALEPKDKGRAGKGAILSGLAAAGGALWFWRRRRSDEKPEKP
jgi:LPXTG-motif cell wall-anchored protein